MCRCDGPIEICTFVGDFHIVNPDLEPPNVNAVETSPVATSDNGVVHLALLARVKCKMESRRIHESEVVNCEVRDPGQAQDPRTVGVLSMKPISISLDRTSSVR